MKHSFEVEIAKKYGIEVALLLDNIIFWVAKNKANNKHFYDGKYWTYNSARAFTELFPYFNQIKIKRLLQTMKEENLIYVGNFNKNSYDRTNWYAVNEKLIQSIVQNSTIDGMQIDTIDGSNLTNGKDENDQPIPDINTDSKQYKDNDEIEDFFESVWQLYPRKEGKGSISKSQKKKLYKIGFEEMSRAITRYKLKIQKEGIEKKYIKQGSTFFNSGYIDYLDSNSEEVKPKPKKQEIKIIERDYLHGEVTPFY
jgi:hypothetical protein